MAAGIFALLDDVAALTRMAASSVDDVAAAAGKASASAVGVVVDDTAVTPQYVQGLAAEREVPIIKKIAIGSLRNKLLIILPIIMVLSQFVPALVTVLLILGGIYLSYEGAEKIYHVWRGHEHAEAHEDGDEVAADEDKIVAEAVRTDLILSTEIMVIALKQVTHEPFIARLIILIFVAFVITALVYGVVALIVKMDDAGLHLMMTGKNERLGRALVDGMPKVMNALSTIGITAMLWVGGHILLTNASELGWHGPYEVVHHAEHAVKHVTGVLGGVLGWCTNTVICAIVGIIVGFLVIPVMKGISALRA